MVNTVYNAAISGLQAASLKLKVSANNVANANTDGYQKQQVTTRTGTYGVEVKVEKVSAVESPNNIQTGGEPIPDPPSNVDVAEELLEMKAFISRSSSATSTLEGGSGIGSPPVWILFGDSTALTFSTLTSTP